jgi:hypothetical protein
MAFCLIQEPRNNDKHCMKWNKELLPDELSPKCTECQELIKLLAPNDADLG